MNESSEQYKNDAVANDYKIRVTHLFDKFLHTDINKANQLKYEELDTNEPSEHT